MASQPFVQDCDAEVGGLVQEAEIRFPGTGVPPRASPDMFNPKKIEGKAVGPEARRTN